MMNAFFSSLSTLFDLLFLPFRNAAPIWPVLAFSVLTAMLMLVVFKYFSNQPAILEAKSKLGAHLLEVRLFQDQIGVVARAYARLLGAAGVYLLHSLKPLAVMLIPLILIMGQLELRLGREARAGQPLLLKATLAPGTSLESVELQAPADIAITAPALPIPELNEIDWRLQPAREGQYALELVSGASKISKTLSIGSNLQRISPLRTSNFWEWLLYPGEARLDGAPFRSVEVLFPARELSIFGWKMHWIVPFFVFSLIFGYALKGVVGVEF